MTKTILLAAAGAFAVIAAGSLAGAEEAKRTGDPYPLDTCALSGEKLGSMGDPVVKVIEGREVRFCCAGCIRGYEADPATHAAKIDAKIMEQQAAHYPVDTCVNAGAPLGDSPVSFVVGNRLVKTCCNNCASAVKADPAKAFEALDKAAIEAQDADYPLETCAVSGEALGSMGPPVNVVIGNRLVKLCCKGCERGVENNPAKILGKLDEAAKG